MTSFTSIETPVSAGAGNSVWTHFRDFSALLKPRVMSLVVFTGFVGMFMAPGELHYVLQIVAIICIAVGAGASGAINMWFDRDIDQIMSRTKGRPIPSGRVTPDSALTFGVLLSGGSVMVMGLAVNWLAASLLAFTIAFYIFIYTIWLKRSTPQNNVIGGAAGALPPVIGWAAISGNVALESLILFAVIFIWTPPHFWALSINRKEDYIAAKIPMMPVIKGTEYTKLQIALYSVLLAVTSIFPFATGYLGGFYFISALVLNAAFIGMAVALIFDKSNKLALPLFLYSIVFLTILFICMALDKLIPIQL